jgi:hypothetical protein
MFLIVVASLRLLVAVGGDELFYMLFSPPTEPQKVLFYQYLTVVVEGYSRPLPFVVASSLHRKTNIAPIHKSLSIESDSSEKVNTWMFDTIF